MLPPDPHTLAALLLAADPEGLGGAILLGPGGPAVDGWCHFLRGNLPEGTSWRRVPVGVTPDRMTGGIDLGATLRSGRRVLLPGIPAEADGGVLVLPSAERIHAEVTSTLLEVLDRGRLRVERDGLSADLAARVAVVALDEARDDEPGSPEALRDRVAFLVTLPPRWTPGELPDPERLAGSADRIRTVEVPDGAVRALAEMSLRGGSPSLRPVAFALRAARGIAALREASSVEAEDVWLAAALVLAPRGVPLPAPPGELGSDPADREPDEATPDADAPAAAAEPPAPSPGDEVPPPEPAAESEPGPPDSDAANVDAPDAEPDAAPPAPPGTGTGLPDRLVAAVLALLPDEDAAPSRRAGAGSGVRGTGRGRGGPQVEAHERGRRVGAHPGAPGRGRRLDLPATLRAAAPWQALRQVEGAAEAEAEGHVDGQVEGQAAGRPPRLHVTREDLHVQRRVRPSTRRTIFAVDASGSQALRRLGEVKGAVELLLVDSYRAREEVCLVVFRDREARLLLPPTRSLTRVKRLLRGLPGGGGTPLALGLAETLRLAETSLREGITPRVVLLTDGRPNVDAAGRGGRPRAREDALAVARALGARGIEIRVLDTGLRPEPFLDELARAMGARARHLPFADARRIRRALADPPPGEPVPSHPGKKSHG